MDWWKVPVEKWFRKHQPACSKDAQRNRLYKAEKVLREQTGMRTFQTQQEMQRYINKLQRSIWFGKRFPRYVRVTIPITVSSTKHLKHPFARGGHIYIPLNPYYYNEAVVLHELAHVICPDKRMQSHGRWFARCYLELVKRCMGIEAHAALKQSYREHSVKFNTFRIGQIPVWLLDGKSKKICAEADQSGNRSRLSDVPPTK
jgi:putative metallohydrolase (TIGR04338 family)